MLLHYEWQNLDHAGNTRRPTKFGRYWFSLLVYDSYITLVQSYLDLLSKPVSLYFVEDLSDDIGGGLNSMLLSWERKSHKVVTRFYFIQHFLFSSLFATDSIFVRFFELVLDLYSVCFFSLQARGRSIITHHIYCHAVNVQWQTI